MADKTIGFRLSPRAFSGYFHFLDVPAVNAVQCETTDLKSHTSTVSAFDLALTLKDIQGSVISTYRRNVRRILD